MYKSELPISRPTLQNLVPFGWTILQKLKDENNDMVPSDTKSLPDLWDRGISKVSYEIGPFS